MARAPKIVEVLEPPPHDALEGAPLPRETTILVGHKEAERTLLEAYQAGRLHHAWILSGERGIGKATLAFRFARFLFANPDPGNPDVAKAKDLSVSADHPAAQRLAAGAHGNLLHLQRDWIEKDKRHRSELSVDSVRRIIPFLGTTAGEGGWRVVIVDPADDMSPSAANAILKNLEEPPKKTLFMLVAERRGALLPTILSRSRTLALDPLSDTETEEVVRRVAPDLIEANDKALAIGLAAGSPRRFIELTQGNGVESYKLMRQAIEAGDRPAQFKLAGLASDSTRLGQFLALFEAYLTRRLRDQPEPGSERKLPAVPLVTLAKLWEKAALSGQEAEEYNLDRRQFVLDLLETAASTLR